MNAALESMQSDPASAGAAEVMPEIIIQATRAARQWHKPDRDTLGSQCFVSLRDELAAALLEDPNRKVRTPGFSRSMTTAADVVADEFAGTTGDQTLHIALKIIAGAAKGEDVQLMAMAWVQQMGTMHGAWHAEDLLTEVDGSDE